MSLRIRRAQPTDLPTLPPLLRAAFQHYQDALVYSDAVLDLFHEAWWKPMHGLLALDGEEPVGVVLAGRRHVDLDGQRLSALHIGPVAVLPELWGHGLGRRLMQGIEQNEADLYTLTVNRVERVGGFYGRLGYRELETWQPQVLDLRRPQGQRRAPACSTRHALVEQAPPLPSRQEPLVLSSRLGSAHLKLVRWPVTSRQGGQVLRLFTGQIVERSASGPELDACLALALDQATSAGIELVWGRPQLVAGLQGFLRGGGEGVSRLAKPGSPSGSAALARALTWLPAGPSP